ncbi:MAG: (4Fe-4S)-binding protein [Bacteroidetes bacterium]|nr:MAG: (4Fe-4S)-binding protein [Bacteroidota bacterium]
MKEIVVISGKGGTGKTSITASFTYLGGKDVVVADCDVDAADMHLLLQPNFAKSKDFYSSEIAKIDQNKCIKCGKCADVCRFNAIPIINEQYTINSLNCEGCGYCSHVCPVDAITMELQNDGKWFISNTRFDNILVHAKLGIGSDNSGKLVAKVKNEAKKIAKEKNKNYIIIDGSPGVGCPVISSISGADFVVLVTEPTVSGLHDLERVYKLVKKFNINAGCIINKADLNLQISKEIQEFLKKEDIVFIANLPYDETFTKAMTAGQTIVEYGENNLKNIIIESWDKIKELVEN